MWRILSAALGGIFATVCFFLAVVLAFLFLTRTSAIFCLRRDSPEQLGLILYESHTIPLVDSRTARR